MIFSKIDWLGSWNNFYRDSEFYKSKTWILTSLMFSLIHSIPEKCRMLWWSLGTNFPMWTRLHCAKRVRIWSYSSPYFPAFGLNTERGLHAFFKQLQAEIWQKLKISNSLRMNFRYSKIIHFFHPRYYQKIIEDIPKNVQKPTTSVLLTLYDQWRWIWGWK